MAAGWPPEEPFVVGFGESEEDSPNDVPADDVIEGADSPEPRVSGEEVHQRHHAVTAYGKAAHQAPRKAAPEPSRPAEEAGDDEERQVQQDLEELSAKAELADEYLLLAQRTQADFENYRKRAARDASLAQERGIAKLAKELLPAVDNLERAVQAAEALMSTPSTDEPDAEPAEAPSAADTQMLDGLKLVHAEVLAALSRAGIEPFSPVGEPFDPQHHEAVAQHQLDGTAPGTVIEVYQQGYRLGETVLRPARVLVAA